jgi:hypothetical protein
MPRVFDRDPLTGTERLFHWNEADESFVIETRQDVTDLVEVNKGIANQHDERTPWKGDMHRVASIPMSVYMDLQKRGIADDERALRRWLDDPDNRVFRTRPGRLSR